MVRLAIATSFVLIQLAAWTQTSAGLPIEFRETFESRAISNNDSQLSKHNQMELERRTCGLDLVVVASIAGCAWVYKQGKEKYRKYKDKKAAAAEQAATDLTADARPANPPTTDTDARPPTPDPPPTTGPRPPTPGPMLSEPNSMASSLTLASPGHGILPKASILGLNKDDQAKPISRLPAHVKLAETRPNNRQGQPEQPEQLQQTVHRLHPPETHGLNAPLGPNALPPLRPNAQPRSGRYA